MDGLHDGAHRIHQVPQTLHQMLSSREFPDLFRVSFQIKRSILNFLIQLFKCTRLFLNFLPLKSSRLQFGIAQGQHLLCTCLSFVQTLFQKLCADAPLFDGLAKAACIRDLFFGDCTGSQRNLLHGVCIYVCLIAQLIIKQFIPPAVQPVLQPLVQPVDGGHENVVQPVGQLRPGLGGLFLVAKEGLEDFHPGRADRVLRRIDGFVEALRLLGRLEGALCNVVVCPGKLIDGFRCGDPLFLCEVVYIQCHLGVFVERLFHDSLGGPLVGKGVAERARIHQRSRRSSALCIQCAQFLACLDQVLDQGFAVGLCNAKAVPVL